MGMMLEEPGNVPLQVSPLKCPPSLPPLLLFPPATLFFTLSRYTRTLFHSHTYFKCTLVYCKCTLTYCKCTLPRTFIG
jgi:hypothetical protein